MKKTNKTFKRFAAITSASLLAACAMAPVFTSMTSYADDPVASPTTVDYSMKYPKLPAGSTISAVKAYKIFNGEFKDANTFNVLSWADDDASTGTLAKILEKLPADSAVKTELEATKNATEPVKAAAEVIASYSSAENAEKLEAFAKAAAEAFTENGVVATGLKGLNTEDNTDDFVTFNTSELQTGYYVVVAETADTDNNNETTNYTSKSLGMLTVTGRTSNNTIGTGTAKVGLPEVIKKVKENSAVSVPEIEINGVDFDDDEDDKYNDIADYNIGATVPFKLYGSMPVDIANYDHYYYKFTDTLGTQFTLENDTEFTISVNNNGTVIPVAKNDFNIHIDTTNGIIIEIEDIKALKDAGGELITIGDKSIITVEYSATLNSTANIGLPGQLNSVDLTYSNNPNVIYNPVTDTKKDDGNGNDTNDKPDNKDVGTTPKDTVIVFTYGAEVDKTFKDAAGNILTPNNEDLAKVTFQIRTDATKESTAIGFTGSNGNYTVGGNDKNLKLVNGEEADTFNIAGLDEGTYYLVETEWIPGFNQADPIKIVVTADTANATEWTSGTASDALKKFTYNVANVNGPATTDVAIDIDANTVEGTDCIVPVPVVNSKGTTLPGTGGIGTTIFYLGGGAMAAIGGIYLISKRRMRKSEE